MSFLSIITPTYNRRELVPQSVDSALQFVKQATFSIEVIVVDDASTDGTFEVLQNRYLKQLTAGAVKLIRSEKNLGVSAAKNLGTSQAHGMWLLFLDSDDLLIPEIAEDMVSILQKQNTAPIIFFRGRELETGRLIGRRHESPYELTLRDLLNVGTPGDCLTVVRSSVFA